jgi:metal-responsive CopG/Arc/MetJ family transcriptional regulator
VKRHNFFLPEELVAQLKAEADIMKITFSEVIRKALKKFIDERRAQRPNQS